MKYLITGLLTCSLLTSCKVHTSYQLAASDYVSNQYRDRFCQNYAPISTFKQPVDKHWFCTYQSTDHVKAAKSFRIWVTQSNEEDTYINVVGTFSDKDRNLYINGPFTRAGRQETMLRMNNQDVAAERLVRLDRDGNLMFADLVKVDEFSSLGRSHATTCQEKWDQSLIIAALTHCFPATQRQ